MLELDASVGDEVREDSVTIAATGDGVAMATGSAAYTYSTTIDRILYAHDVGHAELVKADPTTGAKTTLALGAFIPRSISIRK